MVNKYSRSFEVQSKLFKISTFYILYQANYLGHIITEHWAIGSNKSEPHYRDHGSDQKDPDQKFPDHRAYRTFSEHGPGDHDPERSETDSRNLRKSAEKTLAIRVHQYLLRI